MIRLFHIILILGLLTLAAGCRHHEKDLFFTNWVSESRESDSLVRLLEIETLTVKVPLDTALNQIERLERISPDKANFFKGRFLRQHHFNYEAESILINLKANLDSSRNVYLTQCVNRELALLSPKKATLYHCASQCVNYFKSIGDPIMTAACYIDLANVLSDLNDYEKALYYLGLAQDIYRENGLEELALRNAINEERNYSNLGQREKADSISRILLQAKELKEDKYVREILLRNRFLTTNNPDFLREAISISKNESSLRHLYPLHASLFSAYWFDHENIDSARYYVEESMKNLDNVSDINHISIILRNNSALKLIDNQIDSALIYFHASIEYADSAIRLRDYVKVETLESQRAIAEMELESMEHLFKERILWTIIISALIISILVVLWLANKRHQNAKLQQIQSQLELEQARRSFAAKSIAMEEKERIIGETRKRLQEMSQEGKIKNDVATELVSMIKMHESGQIEWDNFVTLFEKVSPNFTKNLKAQYPDLSETLVKLATYLFAGMSSAQISRLLMIRLESVHQARWRLRKKMGLPNDSSLEDALRKLDT